MNLKFLFGIIEADSLGIISYLKSKNHLIKILGSNEIMFIFRDLNLEHIFPSLHVNALNALSRRAELNIHRRESFLSLILRARELN